MVLGALGMPAAAAPAPIPKCPPDCGSAAAAAGPTLIPYVTDSPGPEWLALTASESRPSPEGPDPPYPPRRGP